ncbi:sugar phosphate isomerase/epimerase [Chitinophaga pendula]|uniref:sugar phosphate isomerase/epimerase family protein n=1 Tax=Chitinophaga TaxID=79328 RepID=UPI000BAE7DCC|nr:MULTISPECIES: sugar phosphate isomerase/epimerase family protein [Chitinophaga]ASZ14268.1 xylose isomerase [Chitinophaga sp. MD30]UCJ08087.1 sugar phosphate isomerase/epimerase [Chitinophaga pendula]
MKKRFLLLVFVIIASILQSNAQKRYPALGVATSYDNDSVLYAAGFVYIEETVRKLLSPSVEASVFREQVAQLRRSRCKIETCNLFIPAEIKIVGPAVQEERVLGYVDTVMQRARAAGIRLIVLGSGGARKLPDGMTPAEAKPAFIALCRKMAQIAARYDCTIAMENLNSTETNFINTLQEANEVVTAIAHPRFKLTADIYHMLKEGETAASIEKAGANLVHCHIAEREKRTAPGVAGDDFRPYFAALKQIGFKGRIMVESRWGNIAAECGPAIAYLQQQLAAAYDKGYTSK